MQSLLHKAVYCMEMTEIAGKWAEYCERPCFQGDKLPFAKVLLIKKKANTGTCKHLTVATCDLAARAAAPVKEPPDPNAERPVFPRFTGHTFLVCAVFFDT
ncbi:hypothetical protein V4W15_27215 [Pseudomonas aeruginosa]|uniref:hypothetical protein n=1 Tax=Pseudomonas aeruginosa TaxID=287 RepID=UPI0032E46EBC